MDDQILRHIEHIYGQAEALLAAGELTPEQYNDAAGMRDVAFQLGEFWVSLPDFDQLTEADWRELDRYLRDLLNGILGLAELLDATLPPAAPTHAHLHEIRASGAAIVQLLEGDVP
jgi:hypothetical protein